MPFSKDVKCFCKQVRASKRWWLGAGITSPGFCAEHNKPLGAHEITSIARHEPAFISNGINNCTSGMLFYFLFFQCPRKRMTKKLSQTIRTQWNVGMEQLVQLIHAFTADTVKQELAFNWSGCLRKWKSRIIQKLQKSYNSRSEPDKYSPKYWRIHFPTLGLKGWLIDSSLERNSRIFYLYFTAFCFS